MASADVLEARLRKVSAAAADIFRGANPANRESLLKSYGIYTGTGGQIIQSDRYMAQAAKQAQQMGQITSGFGHVLASDMVLKQGVKQAIGMGPLGGMPPKIPSGMLTERAMADGVKRALGMGPLNPGGIDWKKAGLGAGVSFFSPWIGARMLNESGFLKTMTGGSRPGGVAHALFGGGIEGFAENYLLIQAMQKLRLAFDMLVGAVKRASDLYVHSAMLGSNATNLGRMRNTFSLLGLSPEVSERMMAQAQFNRGTKISAPQMQGMILGAGAGVSNREEMQALLNMSDSLAKAWNMTLDAARQSAAVTKDLFRTRFVASQLLVEWNTFWEQFTGAFSGVVTLLEMSAVGFLHAMNMVLEAVREFPSLVNMIPGIGQISQYLQFARAAANTILPIKNTEEFKRFGLGQAVSRPESSFERMGLIIHGGLGGTDYARQTAQNTKRMVDLLAKLIPGGEAMQLPYQMAAHANMP